MGRSWSRLKQQRGAKNLLELAPKKVHGRNDPPVPELDRETLIAALQNVAKYISKKKGNVTVIAVGGAVNTIHLKSRKSTHDIDFFNNHLTVKDCEVLVEAAKDASKKDKRLVENWFNNRTILFMAMELREELTKQSLIQGEIIFSKPGLTVLAAPWNYAFCCKLDRLAGGGIQASRPYDIDDAVGYLNRYLGSEKVRNVNTAQVKNWMALYQLKWADNKIDPIITKVNAAYKAKFKVNCIV